jgi:S-layer homology domain.
MRRRLLMLLASVLLFAAGLPPGPAGAEAKSVEEKYEFLVQRGIFTGFDDGSARLNDPMTREQFAAILFRLWELGTGGNTRPSYDDVLKTRWSFDEIEAVTRAGLMRGIGYRKFGPLLNVTVEQLATVLVRGYGASGEAGNRVTGTVSAWAAQDVGIALRRGWIPAQSDYTRNAKRSLLVEAAYAVYLDLHPESRDSEKPRIISHGINPDGTVTLRFSEPVDEASAVNRSNYTFDQGLKITSITLSKDKRTVTIVTERQKPNTVYQLTVRGVKDLAGNRMDERRDLYFVSVVDTTPPTVTKVTSTKNTVELTFSEKLDPEYAEQIQNYIIDGGIGLPLRAVYDDSRQIVTLFTTDQTPGQRYTVRIFAVRDLAGNIIAADTTVVFGGAGQTPADFALADIQAVNVNTLELRFTKSMRDVSLSRFAITIKSENNSPFSMSGVQYYVYRKPGNDQVLTVQFRTKNSSNPELFRSGRVYVAEVSGLSGMLSSGGANQRTFAGSGVANPAPYVTHVTVTNATTIVVHFNEPVRGVSNSVFRLTDSKGAGIPITSNDAGGTGSIVTSVTLKLGASVKAGTVYTLSFRPGVEDAPGWNGWKTEENGKPYTVSFNGVEPDNEAPRFESAYATDRHTIELRFTEPVNGADLNVYRLYDETGKQDVPIAKSDYGYYVVSADKRSVTLHLNAEKTGPLLPGHVYKLSYRESGGAYIADLEGKRLDTSNGGGEVRFSGSDKSNPAPAIKSVDATAEEVRVTFTEPVLGFAGQVNFFELTIDGRAIVPVSGSIDGTVVKLRIPKAEAGAKGVIRISPDGVQGLRDYNGQAPEAADVEFTVR